MFNAHFLKENFDVCKRTLMLKSKEHQEEYEVP